jgi:hypothetical protein
VLTGIQGLLSWITRPASDERLIVPRSFHDPNAFSVLIPTFTRLAFTQEFLYP